MIVLQAGGSTSPLPHLVVFVVGIGIAWVIRALARRRGTTQATLTKGGVAILVVLFVLLVGGSFASLGDPVVSGLFAVMVGVPLLLGLRAWAKREDPAGQQTEPEGGQTAPAERQTASVSSTGEPHSRVPEGPSNEESEAFGEVGSDEQGSSDEQVGPDGRDEPVHRKEQPIWRGAGLRSIVRSGRFTLGGLVVFVTLAVFTFISVLRQQATISQLQGFSVVFVASWLFFYLDLRNEYDDRSKVVGWAVFGLLLFVVAVPLYTLWRVARVVIGPSPEVTPYFKASVGLAFVPVAVAPVTLVVPENETSTAVAGGLFVLSLVLSGVAMVLDLNTDRHWSRAILWVLGALVAFYLVLPYYFYARRRSFRAGKRTDRIQEPGSA